MSCLESLPSGSSMTGRLEGRVARPQAKPWNVSVYTVGAKDAINNLPSISLVHLPKPFRQSHRQPADSTLHTKDALNRTTTLCFIPVLRDTSLNQKMGALLSAHLSGPFESLSPGDKYIYLHPPSTSFQTMRVTSSFLPTNGKQHTRNRQLPQVCVCVIPVS